MPAAGADWRPGVSLELLRARADLYRYIRSFFSTRGVLEVETPLLSVSTTTDLHLGSLQLCPTQGGRYLQTSPESAMKRLLAAYPVAMYQLTKAFRASEQGRYHNPEFTLLEWYRPGYDLNRLMDEVAQLVAPLLQLERVSRVSYAELFESLVGLDPHHATDAELAIRARDLLHPDFAHADRDTWLQLLFSHLVEPRLGDQELTFVFDFPAGQAAQASVAYDAGGRQVARRFELFAGGVELANGYLELLDAAEMRRRMECDRSRRRQRGASAVPADERLLQAMASGLPACAGVALGVDRLLMLSEGQDSLAAVLPFPFDLA